MIDENSPSSVVFVIKKKYLSNSKFSSQESKILSG